MNYWTDILTAGMLAVATVTAWFVWLQIRQAKEAIQMDHTRREKQATLDLYDELSDRIRSDHLKIRQRFSLKTGRILSNSEAKEIYSDIELQNTVVGFLSKLERFSIGIRHDVYHYEIINELSRTRIMNMWAIYAPYIKWHRRESPRAYTELEELVARLARSSEENRLPVSETFREALRHGFAPGVVQ